MPFATSKFIKGSSNSKGFVTSKFIKSSGAANPLETEQGLEQVAERAGLEREAQEILNPKPKLSTLQRLGAGLSSFETGQAVYTGMEKGAIEGVKTYGKGIVQGLKSAITGKDIGQTEKKTYKDIVEKMGVENGIAKWGLGFLGDVLLDPSTYFGAGLVKGAGRAVGKGVGKGLEIIGKVAPETEQGIRLAAEGVKKAAGKAFVFGYGASKGVAEKGLETMSELGKAKEGIVKSNIARLGTGTLSSSQQDELVKKLLAGKRAELAVKESAKKIALTADEFNPISNKLDRMIETRGDYVSSIQKEINKLEKLGLQKTLKTKATVNPETLVSKLKIKTKPNTVNFGENDVVTGGRLGYTKITDIPAIAAARGEQSTKAFIESLIKDPDKDVQAIKKQVATKKNNLSSLFDEIDNLKKEYQGIQDLKLKRLQLADATYAAKKRVATETAKSSDPLVQKTIEEQGVRSQKFAKQAGIDDPFTVYFPGIKKDKIKGFFESTKTLRVGSEGYKKEFKNLLKDEEMVRNPAEAFARREFDVAKDNIVRGQLKGIIGDVGKPLNAFKTEDEALKAGYKVVKEKGMFGKPMGYLLENDKKFLDNLISPEFSTIDTIAKYTGFDAITSLFKRSVTGLFAPFHVRNYVSGLIQNYEVLGVKALSPKNIAMGQRIAYKIARNKTFGNEILKIGTKEYSLNQVVKPFAKRFSTSSSYIADIADATMGAGNVPGKILSKASLKETAKTLGLGQQSIPFRAARAIGNFVETQQKATAYITALKDGKSVKEALDLAAKAGFDYRALTPFESKVLRRIIPFYSFTRKNLELQLKTLGENPQRVSNIMKAMRDAQGDVSPEEKQFLPDFVKEGFFTKVGNDKYGQPQFITQYGTPIEQFAGLFGENQVLRTISQFNPLLKAPIELGIGKDSFRKQDLKDVYNAKEYKMAPQFVKDLLKIKPVEKPVYRNNKKTNETKIDYVADPERLLVARSLFTSRGVSYLDKVFGGNLEGFAQALNLVTGIKAYPIDIESSKYFKERDARRELQDLLQRYGVIKKMEIPYVPKK